MNFKAEAVIAREAKKFVENGLLYRGFRPVMWSPVEKTALAEAEVEYHEKSSPADLCEISASSKGATGRRAFVVIWTTTPWTIPGNRAIAFSPEISYGLYQIADAADGSLARAGEQILLADLLAEACRQAGQDDAEPRAHGGAERTGGDWSAPIPSAAWVMISMCRCCPASMSPPIPAPASSIPRPAMAKTISN